MCSIYGLVLYVMRLNLDLGIEWETKECEKIVNTYCKKRYKDNKLKLPKEIENMIYLTLTNSFRDDADKKSQRLWLQKAYDNSNNSKRLRAK